jgi:prophage maintenance system killer protein
MALKTLAVDDICRIHDALCADFALSADPIFPPGVKSMALLESAVGRQHVGFGPFRKYSTPALNAATLTFGLCNDHPFHNGNKRTALVAMLAHLDGNKQTLADTKQGELYAMMLALATNKMSAFAVKGRRPHLPSLARNPADAEVASLAAWLEPRLQQVRRGERRVSYRELRGILRRFNYELDTTGSNTAEVVKVIKKRSGLLRREPITQYKRVGKIGYHSEGEQVSMKTIKDVRRITCLREEDGCDSEAFYASGAQFDVFINRYRTILRRLASN